MIFSKHNPRIFLRAQALCRVNNDLAQTLDVMSRDTISSCISSSSSIKRDDISAVFVGNMLSGVLQHQSQLASSLVQSAGLRLKDTMTVDAACGSGGAALRLGIMALLSGMHETVLCVGIEYMKHPSRDALTKALAQASDWPSEGSQGATFVGLNDLLHDLYLRRYAQTVQETDFFYFSENSHTNAKTADHALLRKPVTIEEYTASKLLGKRVRLFDACPTANGCAAVILSTKGTRGQDPVVLGSDCKTDYIALKNRKDPLRFTAVQETVQAVYKQAGITPDQVSVFEAHDAYSIMGALSLESSGFCAPGEGPMFAKSGEIKLSGRLPMSTFGGLKARGHPVGASGLYQIGELMMQLKGEAGANQVKNAKIGLTSSFGGAATTVTTHLLGM